MDKNRFKNRNDLKYNNNIIIMSYIKNGDNLIEADPINPNTTVKRKIKGDKIRIQNKLTDGEKLVCKIITDRNNTARVNTINRYLQRKNKKLIEMGIF